MEVLTLGCHKPLALLRRKVLIPLLQSDLLVFFAIEIPCWDEKVLRISEQQRPPPQHGVNQLRNRWVLASLPSYARMAL